MLDCGEWAEARSNAGCGQWHQVVWEAVLEWHQVVWEAVLEWHQVVWEAVLELGAGQTAGRGQKHVVGAGKKCVVWGMGNTVLCGGWAASSVLLLLVSVVWGRL
eukprot:361089-Chlamydomonas_euryale.AAC.4